MSETITSFRGVPYKQGSYSTVVLIPKSKFKEGILKEGKEYLFIIKEVE